MSEIRVTLVPSALQPDPARYFPAEDHIYLVGTSGALTIKRDTGERIEPHYFWGPSPIYDTVVEFSPSGWLSVEVIE